MILFLFEILLMIAAPVVHIILCILYVTGRIKMSMVIISLICLIVGVLLPLLASYIDIMNLPSDVKCATGSVGFAFLGMLFTVVVIPISAIIFSITAHYKRKKLTATVKA
jgi:hypothetical protein